jgi:hypothetical protein
MDMDAPEREGDGSTPGKRSPWLHWLCVCPSGAASTSDGKVITDYMAPSPALGCHRFVVISFKGSPEAGSKKMEVSAHPLRG